MKRFAPVSTSILLFWGNRHNHITVFDETIFVSSMTLYPQAGQTYIHLLFLRCKILVGKSQTLSNLHRPGAGCAMESLNSTKACWSPDVKKNGKVDKIPFAVSKNILLRCDCVGVDLLTALTISASPSRTVKKSRYKRTAPPSDLLR